MADATLQIIFFGMVALVPRYDTYHANNAATVLLPDSARHPYSSAGCPITEHYPLLVVVGGKCRTDRGAADGMPHACETDWEKIGLRQPEYPEKETITGVFKLDREQLVLAPGSDTFNPKLYSNAPDKFPVDPYEAQDFRWIPSPPGLNHVRKECLSGADCPLAARLHFNLGILETCHFAQVIEEGEGPLEERTKIFAYQLGKMSRGVLGNIMLSGSSRAAADAFKATATISAGQPLRITVQSLAAPDQEKEIRIMPVAGKTVTLYLANVTDPDSAHAHGPCERPRLDSHFEVYYDLFRLESTGKTPVGGDLRVPSRSIFSIPARSLGDFQEVSCRLLSWGAPPGGGPVDGDKKVCATFRASANPSAGPGF